MEKRFQCHLRILFAADSTDSVFVGVSRFEQLLFAHLAAGAGLPAQPFRLTGRLRNSDPLTEAVDMKRIIRFFAGNGEYACKQQAKEKNNSSNWFFHDFLPMRQWFRRITADLFSRMQC